MTHEWLLFLPQIPSSPSSLRVFVWRRLRGAGAAGLQNGVWVFPHTPEHHTFLRELLSEVELQGGHGLIFVTTCPDLKTDLEIIERFRSDRDLEYSEFGGRCEDFLREIEKETAHQNYSFAELEENEDDLHKLAAWLKKIQARDFYQGHQAETAAAALITCQQAMDGFTQSVYNQAGLNGADSARNNESHLGVNGAPEKTDGK